MTKFCECCSQRLATFTIPAEKKDEVIHICEPCLKELFDKVMAERAGATIQ